MTYVRFEQKHTDDERWIEAGADAFALHVAAVVYCDRQLTDGHISNAMARRVSLAVPPERAEAAVGALVEHGFWRAIEGGYVIEHYGEHAFPADQIMRTRGRWKADKDRKRQHDNGDHALCKDPKFCPAVRNKASTVESTMDSAADATSGGSRLNQTKPNPTEGRGVWVGDGSASGDGTTTRAAPSTPPPWADEPPPGTRFYVNGKEVIP